MDNRPIMVSIRCATYNHAPYIRQCLDGFVMQKTNFRFEVIVHDDASTDGTTDIVREYAGKYPDIIKPMYEKENQYSRNLPAMNDAINKRLTGKYVALCEGDDYWTDSHKLQKQFDFMESHAGFSLCFHPNFRQYSETKFVEHYPRIKKDIYGVRDVILLGGAMMATNSMFFLRKFYLDSKERPDFWSLSPVGDIPLRLYLSTQGKVGYINDIMSVYRKVSIGSWTTKNKSISSHTRLVMRVRSALLYFDKYTRRKYFLIIRVKLIINYITCLRGIVNIYIIRIKSMFGKRDYIMC